VLKKASTGFVSCKKKHFTLSVDLKVPEALGVQALKEGIERDSWLSNQRPMLGKLSSPQLKFTGLDNSKNSC